MLLLLSVIQYCSTCLSGKIWQELEPKFWTNVEPESKINNFGSATLNFTYSYYYVIESWVWLCVVLELELVCCLRLHAIFIKMPLLLNF